MSREQKSTGGVLGVQEFEGLLRHADGSPDIAAYAKLAHHERAKAVAASATEAMRSLTLRRLDPPPHDLGDAGWWRAMGQAATGQVVLFCHGAVRTPAEAVRPMVGWACQPGVGGVTCALAGGEGLEPGADRPIPAAPAALMAISRAALAQADGFETLAAGRGASDLSLALRLRRGGRRAVLLGRHTASGPADLLEHWRDGPAATNGR